jgi:hypothetical protein
MFRSKDSKRFQNVFLSSFHLKFVKFSHYYLEQPPVRGTEAGRIDSISQQIAGFDVLTSYISFIRVPSSEKVKSQRNSFQPIAAQLPRSAVLLPVVALLWKQNYKLAALFRYRALSHVNVGMK